MYGSDEKPGRVGIEVFVLTFIAIAGLVFFNPALGPVLTGITVAVLLAFDFVFLLAVLGLLPRLRQWVEHWRSARRLRRDPALVPDMRRLAQDTKHVLYDNGQGTLLLMARVFTEPDERLPNEILQRARLLGQLLYVGDTRARWDGSRLITLVRAIVEHFAVSDSALEEIYKVVSHAEISPASIAGWEAFRERYNQLRDAWRRYSERLYAVSGLDATVPGQPVRSLEPRSVGPSATEDQES